MKRPALFIAALVAGASFTLAAWFGWTGPAVIIWKGAGVSLLALWAWRLADGRDGSGIALVLALGAIGDVLLDAMGLVVGAIAFLLGHLVAINLYGRHATRWALPAIGSGLLVAGASALLTADPSVSFYAFVLGAMAGAATVSRFPRTVAVGAWLFVSSDLLIFARLGVLADSMLRQLLVWPLYFTGQALIARGVVTSVNSRDA